MGCLRVASPGGDREEVDFRMKNGDTPPFEKSRKQECFRVLEELLGRLSRAKRLQSNAPSCMTSAPTRAWGGIGCRIEGKV